LWLVGCAALCAAAGCQSGRKELPIEEAHLSQLPRLYGKYQSRNKGQPPPTAEALKKFAQSMPADELKGIGITGPVDSLFVSTRDGEPFGYKPGKAGAIPGMGGETVLFYEKAGKGGRRYVGYVSGKVEEVDDARFKELVPDAK